MQLKLAVAGVCAVCDKTTPRAVAVVRCFLSGAMRRYNTRALLEMTARRLEEAPLLQTRALLRLFLARGQEGHPTPRAALNEPRTGVPIPQRTRESHRARLAAFAQVRTMRGGSPVVLYLHKRRFPMNLFSSS